MKNFYTIQEFSKITGEDVSKLRFYDKIGVFTPIMRDPDNNYRYYTLAQIPSLNFIVMLSDLNVPLKDIANLRNHRTPAELLKVLEKQEKVLDMEMCALRERYSIIHARRELINYGIIVSNGFTAIDGNRVAYDAIPQDTAPPAKKLAKAADKKTQPVKINEQSIAVLWREDKEYHLWPRNEYNVGDTFLQPLAVFINQAAERRINLNFPIGGYWNDMKAFLAAPSRPEHFFTIDPFGAKVRREGKYLIGFNRGYYGDMGDLPERMNIFAKQNTLTPSGPVWVMYMFDEICTHDSSRYLAQACVSVSKTKNSPLGRGAP